MGELITPKLPDAPAPPAAKLTERVPGKPADVTRIKSARGKLEQIAKGVPALEVTASPTENLPNHDTVTALLEEGNALLLEIRDMRLLVNAVATQAIDTPLGNEVRLDALRNFLTVETDTLSPEHAVKILELQNKIKALNLPAPKPEESATLGILTSYNQLHPDKPVPNDVIDAIRSGQKDVAPTVAQMLQSNNDLAQMVWKDLTGVDNFTRLSPSPSVMLDLAGIEKTPDNLKKAQEIFGKAAAQKEPKAALGDQAIVGLMYGAMAIQFFAQLATPEGSGGGGH